MTLRPTLRLSHTPLRRPLSAAVVLALGLSLGACATGSADNPNYVYTLGAEPQNPLVPANTNETGGGNVIDLIFAGLVAYQVDGTAYNDIAENIETIGDRTYRITLHRDRAFSDGTPVLARNFVDAWNIAMRESLNSASFFEPILGFEEGKEAMEGLRVIDDHTFTIELSRPEVDFPLRLGHSAFYPLPDVAFADLAAFGENPVGNGPYHLVRWLHNESITLEPNPHYVGAQTPHNEGVQFVIYAKPDAAYADLLAGNLDVTTNIPESSMAAFGKELGERGVNQPAAIFQGFIIPEWLPHFSGREGMLRRQAISLAIDRELITDRIFFGTRTPAKDFTSPVMPGYTGDVPGNEMVRFDPDRARALWEQANAIAPWDGTFELAYNSDGGHQAWVDATMNSLKNTLGIEAIGRSYPDFKSLRDDVSKGTITTAFRSGWQADYPSLGNFLIPTFSTGGSSNDGEYSSPDFDAALRAAAAAPTAQDSLPLYNDAQRFLYRDLPSIPLWYSNVTGGYSEDAHNVEFNWKSVPDYPSIVIDREN